MRRVVCAACRHPRYTDVMVIGPRHWDQTMRDAWGKHLILRAMLNLEGLLAHELDQGFIDQFGVYMSREEAWTVAAAAGQILQRVGGDGIELYSENLY